MPSPNELLSRELPPNDLSKELLDQVVGGGWNALSTAIGSSSATAVEPYLSLLMTVFRAFNTVALAMAAVLLTWTLFQGVIGTAHEGEPLGKRFSTLWTPIRASVSIAMLAPVAKGLSLIQLMILLATSYSIGFSDYIWTSSVDHLVANRGQINPHPPAGIADQTWVLAEGIYRAEVAQLYLARERDLEFGVTAKPVEIPQGWRYDFSGPTAGPFSRSPFADGDLGSIVVPCTDKSDRVCGSRAEAVARLIADIQHAAAARMNPDTAGQTVPALNSAVKTFIDRAGTLVADYSEKHEEGLRTWAEAAKRDGWAIAGSYYTTMVRFSERASEATQILPYANSGNWEAVANTGFGDFGGYVDSTALFTEAKKRYVESQPGWADRLRSAQEAARGGTGSEGQGLLAGASNATQQVRDMVWSITGPYTVPYIAGKLTEGDPIIALAEVGHGLTGAVEAAVLGYVAATLAAEVASDVVRDGDGATLALGFLPGASIVKAGIFATARALGKAWIFVLPAAFFVYTTALFLAYYLPFLPFILWSMALVGWVLLILETLFAAPLWAIAHAIPEGEGFAGQHGKQGYTMLLAVMIRPPLMLAGLFCAIAILGAIGKLVAYGFLVFMSGAEAGHFFGITATIVYLIMLCLTLILTVHKLFNLITHLPENVTNWIGQHVQNLGEGGDEQRARVIAGAGFSHVEKGAGSAAEKLSGGGKGVGADKLSANTGLDSSLAAGDVGSARGNDGKAGGDPAA